MHRGDVMEIYHVTDEPIFNKNKNRNKKERKEREILSSFTKLRQSGVTVNFRVWL